MNKANESFSANCGDCETRKSVVTTHTYLRRGTILECGFNPGGFAWREGKGGLILPSLLCMEG